MFPLPTSPDDRIVNPMYVPLGAAWPLWFMFAGSAMAGVAFWWMSRWPALYTNLEVQLAQAADNAPALPVPAPAPQVPAVVQEAAAEVVPVAEALTEPVAEPDVKPKTARKAPPADDLPLAH